ncbi:MAG: hypothetical protein COV31_00160 [Candidatus Yanofskybacteria bacterium CG10_big_fil_rev_8_21_14_0_10_46_23]|uniref:Short-chain dehydrogenase n=1 Tax=Candidatus Yanofskybacteria bacterium CG10_big_fil_rev_8_21_14_0_10_46_23 TaxID=1975098 RepID=A0A2H0R534_9BACT|nr:MAG: hypothetical protein COV31_00160 [Candidatus Yanofskybacteria bacterium CG10_big_fil_rev_8_21_14_0_10_46_23]
MARPGNKKIIVITGASKGLGKALAEKLATPDDILILCSRDIRDLNKVCVELKKMGTECYGFKVDISKKTDLTRFLQMTLKRFTKIDILINNAGAIHLGKPIEKITDEELSLCMKTNFDSVFYALQEIIPAMRKRGSSIIVTISSTAGKRGNPDFSAYSASKFAVTGLMQSASRYLEGSGIRCLTIFPAGINTDMRKYILGPEDAEKQQSPEPVAEVIKNAVEDQAAFPNGSEIIIRDGKIVPK